MMGKFELSNKLTVAPILKDKRQKKSIFNLSSDMIKIENSFYLGGLNQSKNRDWSDPTTLDRSELKPFLGFIDVGIDDAKTGEEINQIDSGILLHVKCVDNVWYAGIFWLTDNKRQTLVGISEVDFDEFKLKYLKPLPEKLDNEGIGDVMERISPLVMQTINEVSCSEFVVAEYEPTSSKFKTTVPALRREKYRRYDSRLIREDKETGKKFPVNRAKVFDSVVNNWTGHKNPGTAERFYQRLMKSVLFSGIENQITNLSVYDKVTFDHLPFENFTVSYTEELQGGNRRMTLINCRAVPHGLEVAVYLSPIHKPRGELAIALSDVFLLRNNYTHERIFMRASDFTPSLVKELREGSPENLRLQLVERCKGVIANFLKAINSYEVEKVTGRFRKTKATRQVKESYTPENVHFVLDLSKRRSYESTGERYHACGYHVREHERIGHWRRLPHSEERIYIEGTTVNEGKGDQYGRKSKDYKL